MAQVSSRGTPSQRRLVEIVAHRMDADVARDRADAAADRDGHDIDLAPLQPFGAAHIVGIAPWRGGFQALLRPRAADGMTSTSWRNSSNTSAPANASSLESAVMTLASLRSGVPARSRRSWLAQRGRIGAMVDVSGRVQPAAQFADLLFQDGDGDAGGSS